MYGTSHSPKICFKGLPDVADSAEHDAGLALCNFSLLKKDIGEKHNTDEASAYEMNRAWSVSLAPENAFKLITKEDPGHVHKIIGI